jgi:hypothetical protein
MTTIREDLIEVEIRRAEASLDYNIYRDLHSQTEFKRQKIFADNSLTEDEKAEAIRLINKSYDRDKVIFNSGVRRVCENCNQECLATLYCEYCIRNYLKANFPNWTSGNDDIDILIQKCQSEALMPNNIVEWIPYNNLKNIKYLTEGGFSKIYRADWIGGCYEEWNSEKQQLERTKRPGIQNIVVKAILKELGNVESASQSWFEEVCNPNI